MKRKSNVDKHRINAGVKRNERQSGGVTYWSTRNDPNRDNSHAAALGMEFFAFPFQGYLSPHIGGHMATISQVCYPKTRYVNILELLPGGRTRSIIHKSFQDNDDVAFMFAAVQLRALEAGDTLTELYWDCECKDDYIHPKAQTSCPICGATSDEQPDSHLKEVLLAGFDMSSLWEDGNNA